MNKNKKNDDGTPSLPEELIVEILLRLPVRSVLRFKSVCKSWGSLISNSQFAKLHFDLAAAPSHRLLNTIREATNYDGSIESIDTEASLFDDSASVYLLLPPPLPLDPHYRFTEILGSCRGFVLLNNRKGDLVVWNPSTGFQKRVSVSHMLTSGVHHGFGYDASTDDYLVISIFLDPDNTFHDIKIDRPTTIEFFSLKTNSWSTMEAINVIYKDIRIVDSRTGSLLNGALHWLVLSLDKRAPVIIAFDLIKRSLLEIPLPDDLVEYYMKLVWDVASGRRRLCSLRVMGGCLSVCCDVLLRDKRTTEIWVMKEYEVFSSWTKSVVVSTCDIFTNHFLPLCITKDGGIFGSNIGLRLEKLNDKGELLESVSYAQTQPTMKYFAGNLRSRLYRESLLSLPPYSRETSEDDQLKFQALRNAKKKPGLRRI